MRQKLVPLVVQDFETKQVLSLFYCNNESIKLMKKTGFVWRYSRSRKKLQQKGATSGNTQKIINLSKDCNGNSMLAIVKQEGQGACHLNQWSCFSKRKGTSWGVLEELCKVIESRRKNPSQNSYTASLLKKPSRIGKKLLEEAKELTGAMLEKQKPEVVWEAADLLFFTLLSLQARGVDLEEVIQELKRRRR